MARQAQGGRASEDHGQEERSDAVGDAMYVLTSPLPSRGERRLALALAVVVLGFACYVGFITKPEAATAALVILAGLLLFVAAFGHRIHRLRWRSGEVALALLEEAEQQEQAGEEEKAELLRWTAASVAPHTAARDVFAARLDRLAAAAEYEDAVLDALESAVAPEGQVHREFEIGRSPTGRFRTARVDRPRP